MMSKFKLECWNPHRNRYEKFGEYSTIERAEIMFNKPYFQTRTRRLVKIQIEVLYTEKGKE